MNLYEKQARVYPSIVGILLPVIVTAFYFYDELSQGVLWWQKLLEFLKFCIPIAVVYSAIAYWIRQLFIDTSKWLFQSKLFHEDETEMPTTNLLLWTNEEGLSKESLSLIASKVYADFNISLLTKEQETHNIREAKKTIVDAVGKIREVTRENDNVQQYNRKYGFCRNYLGASVYSVVYLLIVLVLSFVVPFDNFYVAVSAFVFQVLCSLLVFKFMKLNAVAYARALFNAYLTEQKYDYKNE